ncbi:Hpt domain-containing protein [Flavobacteriales bacterium]|nr:Hpt domain-containing protein [Flavobacteriales bacterium]
MLDRDAPIFEVSEEIRNSIIQVYLRDASQSIIEIEGGTIQKEHEVVRKAAHKLKGASATLGATEMTNICRDMENPVMQNMDMLHKLKEAFKTLKNAIA